MPTGIRIISSMSLQICHRSSNSLSHMRKKKKISHIKQQCREMYGGWWQIIRRTRQMEPKGEKERQEDNERKLSERNVQRELIKKVQEHIQML